MPKTPTAARSPRPRSTRLPSARKPSARKLPGAVAGADGLLGRTDDLVELTRALGEERLVTLTGAPGIGKTRLALALADASGGASRGDACVTDLASVTRPVGVARALASALSVDEQPGQGLTDTLVAHIAKRRLLVVLDNCEHLLGACGKLVGGLLSSCPQLRVLATSREQLGLDAERVWEVLPLAFPASDERVAPEVLADFAAVALFLERARAVQSGFALNAYVADAVAEICRRLDGVPLAIELAAARVDSLTPQEIARRLDDRFTLLVGRTPGGLARHQTLQAALDWSHELLDSTERALLRRLSVFVGGFGLEAAEELCGGGELQSSVAETLDGLVAKSLVTVDAGDPPARYRMLETIRAYATGRLEQAGDHAALRAAHVRYYLALAERAEPELTGPDQQGWFGRLETERGNLRSALEWALGHGEAEQALRLAGALVLFWRVRGHFGEGRELLDAAVTASDGAPPALWAKALWGAGFMALMAGDYEGAAPALEESFATFRELGDRQGCARALLLLGNCHQSPRAEGDVLPLLEQSAALARDVDDQWCLAHALGVAGFEHERRGALPAARAVFEECLAVARTAQDDQGLRFGLIGLGAVALHQGDHVSAESHLEEALAIACELDEDYSQVEALQNLGRLALERGDHVRADRLLHRALALIPEAARSAGAVSTLLLLGRAAHCSGNRSGARRRLEDALGRAGAGAPIMALQWMGDLAAEDGHPADCRRLLEEALARGRLLGQRQFMGLALHGLGRLARDAADIPRAAMLHHEALELQREIGAVPAMVSSVEALAGLSVAAGGHAHAARLLSATHTLRRETGYARAPWESARHDADLAEIRRSLPRRELETARAQGARLSIEEAAIQASEGCRRLMGPARGWSSLTERERRIAVLVSEGLANSEIAERLWITVGTVKNHLSSVFSKLGVRTRTEVAREVWRWEQQRPERR